MTETRRLGKYEIIEEIGRGANGIVYQALDTRLQRIVALKVLHPRVLWEPDLVARFYKEASAAARLDHANILEVYDVDEAEGVHYIAMKYLPGRSIRRILDEQGPLPLKEAVPIVRQIAAALDHAHGEGLLHRDIRPSNIMVDDQGHATLMDFGLSVGIDSAYASGPSGLTGTAEYIAPEVWRNHKPDERSDLYSLGVVVYEMLVGEPPFEADSAAAIMTKHLTEEPAFPAKLPPSVRIVLARALAKEKEERYRSGHELAEALGQPATKHEPKAKEKERAETPRLFERGWIVAGVLGLLVAAGVLAVILGTRGLPAAVAPTDTTTGALGPTDIWTFTPVPSQSRTPAPTMTATSTRTRTPTHSPTSIPSPSAAATPGPPIHRVIWVEDDFEGTNLLNFEGWNPHFESGALFFTAPRDGTWLFASVEVPLSNFRLVARLAGDGDYGLNLGGARTSDGDINYDVILFRDGHLVLNVHRGEAFVAEAFTARVLRPSEVSGFHDFGLDYDGSELTLLLDGEEVGRVSRAMLRGGLEEAGEQGRLGLHCWDTGEQTISVGIDYLMLEAPAPYSLAVPPTSTAASGS
ncbi:MAG TPA: protein kinase, partial [Anaerolineae bacterium]|nr:protein kinase [Anaerolineae bacterium]